MPIPNPAHPFMPLSKHIRDVILSACADGDVLTYEAASALWKNKAPSIYNPWTRLMFISEFGTSGWDRIGGSGYLVNNCDFYLVIGTGTTINSYYERLLAFPWLGMAFKQEWEFGFDVRTNIGYAQRYFLWGNATMASYGQTYTDATSGIQYAGFYLVRDATYDRRILAVTRVGSAATITDCGSYGGLTWGTKLKIELIAANNIKYYVNNVLAATHTTPALNFASGGLFGKFGISNQAANAEQTGHIFVRGMCDY